MALIHLQLGDSALRIESEATPERLVTGKAIANRRDVLLKHHRNQAARVNSADRTANDNPVQG